MNAPKSQLTIFKNQLRRVLLRTEILKKAEQLQAIAYATPGKNRAVFTPGHKATTDWIYNQFLALSDYYTVKYHEFEVFTAAATVSFDSTVLNGAAAALAPEGEVTGELINVPNLGCDAVCLSCSHLVLLV